MSPQRPGNENFPANQVTAPVAQEVGLRYQPWYGGRRSSWVAERLKVLAGRERTTMI